MDLGISGKVAFIAGGSKGIARSVSSLLAADGCKVAIVARDRTAIDRAVKEVTAEGGTAMGVSADLSTQEGVNSAVAEVTEEWGSPDICLSQITALGPEHWGAFSDVPVPSYANTFDLAVLTHIRLAHAVVPEMRRKGWGRFVHLGTLSAAEAATYFPSMIHNTVQPAMMGFLKSMSDELAREGITFNSVAPGWVNTEMLHGFFGNLGIEPDGIEPWVLENQNVPIGRLARPVEVASMIAYLCSDLAGYCTGNHIPVDGSMHRSNC
ncbi:SDR family oxidoreductase [Nocardia xishanensis]|uniref:3-oxoacyl-[acyl-carrier-protein] reductase MabA n=1 Tax=Nocardia xishanensis TaxID=238964 RepID=A0ABW7XBR8_9NOCA